MIFLAVWVLSQLCVGIVLAYESLKRNIDWDKDAVVATCVGILLGPITMMGIFGAMTYDHQKDKKHARCVQIMAVWENLARVRGGDTGRWEWYGSKSTQEARFNLLREVIREMPKKDLDFLSGINKATYEIEPALRDAIVDELIERRILDHK